MAPAHIAGVPIEETLLSLGGPAAIYLTAIGVIAALGRARSRLGSLARRRVGRSGAVEAGDRVDGQIAVDLGEADEVVAITRPIGEALETNDAAQACD